MTGGRTQLIGLAGCVAEVSNLEVWVAAIPAANSNFGHYNHTKETRLMCCQKK